MRKKRELTRQGWQLEMDIKENLEKQGGQKETEKERRGGADSDKTTSRRQETKE